MKKFIFILFIITTLNIITKDKTDKLLLTIIGSGSPMYNEDRRGFNEVENIKFIGILYSGELKNLTLFFYYILKENFIISRMKTLIIFKITLLKRINTFSDTEGEFYELYTQTIYEA